MDERRGPILYVAGELPRLSETFVTREIQGVRRLGIGVVTASVHDPAKGFVDEDLRRMASSVVRIYGPGAKRLVADVFGAFRSKPLRTLGTLMTGLGDALTGSNMTVSRRGKTLWQCMAGVALAHRVRGRAPTHVHAHFAHVPTTIAMHCARQLGVGFSFTGHANDLFRERTLLEQKLRRAEFVSCISGWHRAWYREVESVADRRAPIIRCGVPTDHFKPGSSPDPKLIAAVGRLVEKKGFATLIEACGMLRDKGIVFRCEIVGDGPEAPALGAQIERLGLVGLVGLIGARPNEQVLALVRRAAVFCLPCQDDRDGDRDGIPVALMEAMACGVATVSGDLPAIRELIDDGETGRLVPPGDAQALAEVLESLLRDPASRSDLGARSRAWIEQEFSLDTNAQRLADAFEQAGAFARTATATPAATSMPA
ncbi:MAG: glycosyltransferase family 4 protein [Planctomycetota bacterium]